MHLRIKIFKITYSSLALQGHGTSVQLLSQQFKAKSYDRNTWNIYRYKKEEVKGGKDEDVFVLKHSDKKSH
jgi:hypothetical protein